MKNDTPETDAVKILKGLHDFISAMPINCFGSGDNNGQEYPIRDEVLDNICKAIADARKLERERNALRLVRNPNGTAAAIMDMQAELTQLRKACDELADYLSVYVKHDKEFGSGWPTAEEVLGNYRTLSHTIKAKGKGRNRFNACIAAGVNARFEPYTGNDPAGFVESVNDRRRHSSEPRRATAAARRPKRKSFSRQS
jgi:hypothetical protein